MPVCNGKSEGMQPGIGYWILQLRREGGAGQRGKFISRIVKGQQVPPSPSMLVPSPAVDLHICLPIKQVNIELPTAGVC